jgi:hypothetical protein
LTDDTSKLADHLRALPDDGLRACYGCVRTSPYLFLRYPPPLAQESPGGSHLDALDLHLGNADGLRLVRDGSHGGMSVLLVLTGEAGVAASEVGPRSTDLGALHRQGRTRRCTWSTSWTADEPYRPGRCKAIELDDEVAELVQDAAGLSSTLLAASPEARAVLDRLAAGPPIGSVQPGVLRPTHSGQNAADTGTAVKGEGAATAGEERRERRAVGRERRIPVLAGRAPSTRRDRR